MKYVDGKTLKHLFGQRDAPGFRLKFLSVFQKVCETVAYAHARRVVHRDLKPSNVMIGAFGEVQVVDWGLAKVVGAPDPTVDYSGVTGTPPESPDGPISSFGTVVGTPAYMAPEQASGRADGVDERADVFALGAMLCQFLIGRPPSIQGGEGASTSDGLAEDRRRLRAIEGDSELVALACDCLAHDPAQRPRSAAVLATALARHLADGEERAARATLEAATQRARALAEAQAHRRTTFLGGSLLLSLVIVGALVFRSWNSQVLAAHRSSVLLEEARNLVREARYDEALLITRTLDQLGNVPLRLLARLQLLRDYDRLRSTALGLSLDDAVHQELSSAYRAMFAHYGVNPFEVDLDVAAREFSDPELLPDMVELLDEWSRSERVVSRGSSAAADRLLELADRLDEAPQRRAIRGLVRAQDARALREHLRGPGPDEWSPSTLTCVLETIATLLPREELGDIQDVYEACHRVVARHPGDVQLRLQLAGFCLNLSRTHGRAYLFEALEHLTRALALGTESPGAWILQGVVRERLGDAEGARASLDRALASLDPGDPTANRVVSRLMGIVEHSPILVAALERELREAPDSVDLLYELAWHIALFGAQGADPGRALEALERAIALDPDDTRLRSVVPLALYRAGRAADCERAARELSDAGQGSPLLDVFRAMSLHELGQGEPARALYRSAALRRDPSRVEDHVFAEGRALLEPIPPDAEDPPR